MRPALRAWLWTGWARVAQPRPGWARLLYLPPMGGGGLALLAVKQEWLGPGPPALLVLASTALGALWRWRVAVEAAPSALPVGRIAV